QQPGSSGEGTLGNEFTETTLHSPLRKHVRKGRKRRVNVGVNLKFPPMQARSAEKIENTVYTLILLGILATVLSGFRVVHLHKTYSVTESILVNKQSEV